MTLHPIWIELDNEHISVMNIQIEEDLTYE